MQITSAMKMVSAAKLRRAQDAIIQMRPYAEKLQEILINLSAGLDASEGIYSQQREEKNILLVSITSNRGLCGAFNANIIKKTKALVSRFEQEDKEVKVLCIGKKTEDVFKKTPNYYTEAGTELGKLFDALVYDNVAPIAEHLMAQFAEGNFDKIILVYNKFKNAASQIIMDEQFLPILPPEEQAASSIDYIFEPAKEEIVQILIPKSLKTQLYKALLDSHAAEHGARMTAMHQATDNAAELKRTLSLEYNKARQAAITKEILEIVAGAEALEN